jgi:hypothetical protein
LANIFYNSKYDISKLLKEIFKADWFYEKTNIASKIKSPIEWIVGLQRQLGITFENEKALLFVQKALGQMLLYPPNVAGWKGGRAWIDSTTLMFRIKFPMTIMQGIAWDFEAKEEEDAGKQGIFESRIKKLQTDIDWEKWKKIFEKTPKKQAIEEISQFMWQSQNKEFLQKITNYLQKEEDFIPKAVMAFASAPEYQVM